MIFMLDLGVVRKLAFFLEARLDYSEARNARKTSRTKACCLSFVSKGILHAPVLGGLRVVRELPGGQDVPLEFIGEHQAPDRVQGSSRTAQDSQ